MYYFIANIEVRTPDDTNASYTRNSSPDLIEVLIFGPIKLYMPMYIKGVPIYSQHVGVSQVDYTMVGITIT